jgi:hypothetical protein
LGGDSDQLSNALLEQLIQKLPDIPELRASLGLNLQRMGRHAEAIRRSEMLGRVRFAIPLACR